MTERQVRVTSRQVGKIVAFAITIVIAALFVFPLYWMLVSSLETSRQVFSNPPTWWPGVFRLLNYASALEAFPFVRYFINSLLIAVPTTVFTTFSSALVAYGFSRLRWPFRDVIFYLVIGTLIIPSWVTLVPLYIMFNQLGLVDTYVPLIIPDALGGAFSIFLLRQFFLRQPRDLVDAALVDGASHFRVFLRIVLPLARPALAVVALFAFINSWSDFTGPLVYLSNPSLYTLQLGLYNLIGKNYVNWPDLMAASLVVMLPMVVVFFGAQRRLIEGITFTGIRG
jgi:multiple sugar transport system permease protein